jgi:hypothetical protein
VTKNEGSTIYFNGTGDDTDGNVTDYQWDFGDGNNTAKTPISPAAHVVLPMETHVYGDNGTFTVTLTVWDNVGDTGTNTTSITVNNVAPKITSAAPEPEPSDEGSTVWFNATATDPGSDDILTYTWNFGDGSPTETGPQVTHTYTQNDSYSWSLLVEDDDGGSDTIGATHIVNNVAPTITSMTDDPSSTNPGETVWFNSTATDPGDDTLTYTWDFGDGTPTAPGQNVTHVYSSAATYTYALTVDDGDGGVVTDSGTHLVSPWDVDYILIVNASGGSGSEISNQTVDVGVTITGWAAAYNDTAGYIADVSVDWSITNYTGSSASTSPTTNTNNSTFNAGLTGGYAHWKAYDGSGHDDVVNFTINAPTIDEIEIRDAPNGGGNLINDTSVSASVDFNITGFAASYNDTADYIGDVSVTWNVINTTSNACTDPLTGYNSTFNAGTAEGTAIWYANYTTTIFDWVSFTIIIPQVDKIVIESEALNAGTEIPDPLLPVDVGYTIQGWAAGYNTTLDIYLSDVSATWSVVNSGGAEAFTSPLTGLSSTFNASLR